MEKYDHKKIEGKWQKRWKKEKLYKTTDDNTKPKYYVLDMFPYPSGAGLHVGHPKGYIATDIFARAKMLEGYNVLHPMGWDAFGLPTENYALQNKIHPRAATEKNIAIFKKQLGLLGFTYDWSREINTTDPAYYKWTQWAFLKMFERGLAYESYEPINWCPECQTGLSNEDLEDGRCERCGSQVERKPMRQWMLKITAYAERLLNDLEKLPAWEESIKEMQRNWIGKSEGAEVDFEINGEKVKVFTTRPDTLFGATYFVLSPEHPLIEKITSREQKPAVAEYIKMSAKKSDLERTELQKEKTGVFTGAYAINPVNQEKLPVWIADYVLMSYGTGAIMAVPAHDERDWEFARKYDLPIRQVIAPGYPEYKLTLETLEALKEIYEAAEKQGIKFWLLGGLACAFYACIIYREHKDLDLITKDEVNRDKFIKLLEKFGFKKTGEKKISNNLVNFIYQRGKIEVDIGPNKGEFGLTDDFEEDIKFLGKYKSRVLSKRFIKVFKEHQIKSRNQEKDKIDIEYLKGKVFIDTGFLVNSGEYNGLTSNEARGKIISRLQEKNLGKQAVNYKLKDWVFSRQRYWGEPIPVIHCQRCKKLKPKILLIHGLGSRPEDNWYPWFKKQMEAKGFEVFAPHLPDENNPKVKNWLNALKELKLDDGSQVFVVGHSLGAVAACRFITTAKVKVKKLILVAPVGPGIDWSHLKKQDFSKQEIKVIENFSDDLNLSKVKKLAQQVVLYISPDDPYIPMEIKNSYEDLNPQINVLPGKAHFSYDHGGLTEFPELLEEFSGYLNLGIYPVPEKDLPLKLPEVKNYEPSGTGESPLANIKDWVNTKCPNCGGPAKRETNTMPQWAGSSWYYLRYIDPKNKKVLVDKEKEKYWSPVDFYVGGAEHATRHLIYARFWHKFLFDIGAVNYDEPFTRFQYVGLILAEDGRKMSKRWHNVINPDEMVKKYGADAMRVYEMFMGPFKEPCAWSTNGLIGGRRFLEKVWNFYEKARLVDCGGGKKPCENNFAGLPRMLHKTIKKVTEDIENFHFNTVVSQLMIFMNFTGKLGSLPRVAAEKFLILLSPFAPHLAEELWSGLGHKQSIFKEKWPAYDPKLAKDEIINLVIQVNGKVRDIVEVEADISEKEAEKVARESEKIKKWLEGREVKKVIVVKERLVNIVI